MGNVRRIVGNALVAAVLAGGVGTVLAPDAAARPRVCGNLIGRVQHAYDRAVFDDNLYGESSSISQAAWRAYGVAVVDAGCYA